MKTSSKLEGRMAMVAHTDSGRVCVTTHLLQKKELSLKVNTLIRGDDWAWKSEERLQVRPSPYVIDEDYHHYALVIDQRETAQKRGEPPITLYMDGRIASSNSDWDFPNKLGSTLRGVWFGSVEPLNSHYQNPWDNSVNLEGHYRDIRIWDKGLSARDIFEMFKKSRTSAMRTEKVESKKKEATKIK
ncbi:hypothetical protein K7432_017485 [Basidiobolus ranarum]|uniref:Uncharacterized protein n=1 Tax=Basidiobolus ranarum TaxID=34480 RepID=A0ABR2WDB5_9FUNG